VAAALALAGGCGGCGGALAAGDPEPFVGLESLCSAPLQVTVRQPTAGELQQMELVSGTDIMVTYAVVQTGVAGTGLLAAVLFDAVAALAAWRTRQLWVAIAVGMAVFWLLRIPW